MNSGIAPTYRNSTLSPTATKASLRTCGARRVSSYLFVGIVTATAGVLIHRSVPALATRLSSRSRCFQSHCPWVKAPLPLAKTTKSLQGGAQLSSSATSKTSDKKRKDMVNMYGGGTGVSVPSRGSRSACVIFLHGLGDTGGGWAPAFPMASLGHVETILPSADTQAVSLNGGMPMPSWFDLYGLDDSTPDDEEGILRAVERVERIIDQVTETGIPSHRIVVAGFSQGGALALTTGLRSARPLAAVVAMSSWLPLRNSYPQMLGAQAKQIPFFMAHGTADQVVAPRFGQLSAQKLEQLGVNVSMKPYPGVTHSASEDELRDVENIITSALPPL